MDEQAIQPTLSGRRRGLSLPAQLGTHPRFVLGATGLAIVVIIGIVGVFFSPYEPNAISVRAVFRPPGPGHWFGTDNFGRDVWTRVSHGLGISLGVGLAVASLSALAGTTLGALAGYYRLLDGPIMRTMDALMAYPSILLALGIAAALGPSMMNIIIALTITYTPEIARIVRSSVLVLRDLEYVDAARSFGARDRWIILRHLVPNALSPLIVQLTSVFAYAVLAEAALSYLGVGLPPPTPSWGAIVAGGRNYIVDAWWVCLFPGLAITVTVLALNLIGDGLRDIFDPRLKASR